MADATYLRDAEDIRLTTAAAASPGECWQMADGRAAFLPGQSGVESGARIGFKTDGQVTMPKPATFCLLDGGKVFWDHSANTTSFKKVNDRDFLVGVAVGDAALADTTCVVNLNVKQNVTIDLLRDGALTVPTGTQAVGGFGFPEIVGGVPALSLTATNEAQCVDLLSVDRVAVSSNPIAEIVLRVAANGSTSAVDITAGLANGTSTTDADAITESVFAHIDGGSLAINAESDDGTTEVAATDTTKVFAAGSAVANRFELWFDLRNPADIQIYVEGVNVLPSTVFTLAAATGPLGLLVHLEKSSSTATAGPVYVDRAQLRTMEQ